MVTVESVRAGEEVPQAVSSVAVAAAIARNRNLMNASPPSIVLATEYRVALQP
jgi:hypothetical protein